ncbi:hypothetical protein MUA57_10665 [Staphylococcus simulans]|uniref:hypothetical protein n=1 Tax=Staphylococcus simulans TaxID=1286 RepID=UPI0021D17175|nr:hypothetical protein [Staphylococcus simulans]UXR47278.1 hypothetical protein MUA57_10665 [Staphylococcus simulans]
MTMQLLVFIAVLIVIQLIIGHFIHEIGFSFLVSIGLMLLPLGIGIYLLQIAYFEQKYPNWEVPFNVKLRLKHMYLLTFVEYIALYVCFFVW